MLNIGRQEGMSMLSIVSLIMIGIIILLLAFKIVPPYVEDIKIGTVIKRVANQQGAGSRTAAQLKESLQKGFDVEYITSINPFKDVQIQPRGANAKQIDLVYEVEIKLVGNLSALLYFEHEYEAR